MVYYFKNKTGEGYSLHKPEDKEPVYQVVSFRSFMTLIKRLKNIGFFG